MDRAIGMNRAAAAYRAQLLLFLWLLAHGPVRCQDFIPVPIALFHRIHLALMVRAIWVAGFFAKTLGAVLGGEIEPTAYQSSLRQQFAAKCVPRCDLALRVANGNVLRDGLAAVRVVDGVGGDDRPVLREGRVDFPN